jgi:hypothetical protein
MDLSFATEGKLVRDGSLPQRADKFTHLAQKLWAMPLEEYTRKMTDLRRQISYSALGKNIRVTAALKTTFKYSTYLSSSKKPS